MRDTDPQPDIPFPSATVLSAELEMYGVSKDDLLVTCHTLERTWTFPRPFHAFITLLLNINNEITGTWAAENRKDRIYWTSLRAYLNDLLENTLTALQAKRRPTALARWLHREFMLCRHDEAGRREYLRLMKNNGIAPYSVDMFELDWWTWWETQTEHGYYAFSHFKRFEKLLKADQEIIKAAAASELWYDIEEEEDQGRRHANLTDRDRPMLPMLPNPKSRSARLGSIDADTDMEPRATSILNGLSHAPPKPPRMDDGGLDWDGILACLSSLSDILTMPKPDVPRFLIKFDQVRFLEKDALEGFEDLTNFLHEICEDIQVAVRNCHADLMEHLEKALSLNKKEALEDIDTIMSWLQQFQG
ncbi:hypothetical protein HD554DRAFT_2181017 [Boletus coccyginus]|nr:hypothetical protein HD554DRAFT_2181017 [Boletus coccyginus]